MADKASGEKAGEKSFFARTAKNTTKKAKRAQEKVKRKLGKSEETKDEMFDRYVENFNKQQEAVQRLQKELKNYINCLKEMLNANQLFGEAVKQVYEPAWSGREKFVRLLDSLDHSWKNLVQQLQDEVLEPLTSYQIQFPDTKNRIAKRSRKVVDYDRNRHHLETLKVKGGKTGDPKKLSQAEEDYNQAKNAYLQLHSDLYEELPALYDSRISIYVSSFQSIFTAEGVFHRETAKIKTEMNDLLDVLAKETSAGAYSTRRPLSGISNVSSDGDSSPENCAKYDQNDGNVAKHEHTEENSENETSENDEANDETDKPPPDQTISKPPSDNIPENSRSENAQEMPTSDNTQDKPASENSHDKSPSDNIHQNPPSDTAQTEQEIKSNNPPVRPPQPSEETPSPNTDEVVKDTAIENENNSESTDDAVNGTPVEGENVTTDEKNGAEKEEVVEEKQSNIDLSCVLYKVETTHPYTGEDDDELTFEKGDIIQVIPYNESDDPDDGWLLGIMESTGVRGVFPENFTKKLDG